MLCPKCHSKMQEGFVPTGGGMFWFRKGQPHGSVEFARYLPGTFTWERRHKMPAHHCPGCQLVVFRYGKHSPEEPVESSDQQPVHV